MNEAIYRSPEWLRKFADFELRTGKDLKSNQDKSETGTKKESGNSKSEWDKKWAETDESLFVEFYKEIYPKDSRERYRNIIWSSDLEDIRNRYRGDFEIWTKFDIWLKQKRVRDREKADREEAERREKIRKEQEQERIAKVLDDLYDSLVSDFRKAPYRDKASTPTIDGKVCFKYIFEDGSELLLKDNELTYGRSIYTLGLLYRSKFIKLANAIFESPLWKANHQRPSSQRRQNNSGAKSNNPKSNHPKWGLYQNLKQTVIRREEQLKKMSKDDPERQALENEYRVAKATLDKLKNQYQFEHLKSFEEYLSKEEFEAELVKSRGVKYPDEVDFIEDLFMEYADKWNMRHGKYISSSITQPKGFSADDYNLWYTVYESFNPKLARLYVPSDYYIELNIQAHAWKGGIDKEKLFEDVDKFLNRVQKYGWKYVESKTQNRRTFLNTNTGIGEHYDNNLRYYFYKD